MGVVQQNTQSTYQERREHRVLMTRSPMVNIGNYNGRQEIGTLDQTKKGDTSSSFGSHFRIAQEEILEKEKNNGRKRQPYLQYHPCNLLYLNLRVPL